MASGHPPLSRRARVLLAVVLTPLVGATLVGLVALRPTGHRVTLTPAATSDATVTTVRRVPCAVPTATCFRATVKLANGSTAALEDLPTESVRGGDAVTVALGDDGVLRLAGHRQGRGLLVALVAAAAVLVALGRLASLRVLVALGLAVLVAVAFAVPAVLDGRSAVAVAVVAAAAVAIALVVVAHGVGPRALTALAGALLALLVAGGAGRLVGLAAGPPTYLHVASGRVPMDGLLLAGVVLGAVGAVVDLALRQVDATWDLRGADPEARWVGIAMAGIRVGRANLAGAAATLSIAYLGVALPALVLLDGGVADAVRGETIAVELGRAALGVLALASVVPITALLAAATVVAGPSTPSESGSGDPRRFRSRHERVLWEEPD